MLESGAIEVYIEEDGASNPFILNVHFDYVEHTQIRVVSGQDYKNIIWVEEQPFTKLFHVTENQKKKIMELNAGSFRLFMLIALNLAPNTDRIRIFTNKYMELMGITSRTTFNTAINGLTKADILTHYRKNIYWLNTMFLFNGERLDKYPGKGNEVGKKQYYLKNAEFNKKTNEKESKGEAQTKTAEE